MFGYDLSAAVIPRATHAPSEVAKAASVSDTRRTLATSVVGLRLSTEIRLTHEFDARLEVDRGLPAGRLVELRVVGHRVVDVVLERVLDVLGANTNAERVVDHRGHLVERLRLLGTDIGGHNGTKCLKPIQRFIPYTQKRTLMKLGRTSLINFISETSVVIVGFLATIVLTRTLGQDRYGVYVVVISVLSWTIVVGDPGISIAIKKRISEATNNDYIVAGIVTQLLFYLLVSIYLWVFRDQINSFMNFEGTWIVITLLALRLAANFTQVVLDGQHLVHISSLLTPVESASRSIAQICLVLAGAGVTGALIGYAVGAIAGTLLGIYFISIRISKPTKEDFRKIKSYAQFSWLSRIRGRTFLSMDTIILAAFVSNSLVAAYEIAWNLASIFSIFSSSIRRTLFPEISDLSSQNQTKTEVSELLRVSLLYSGIFIIPGLVGGALVGDVVLRIYGDGFTQAYYILLILTFARLLYGYQGQFLTVLNAIDKPNITFRINVVFVTTNLILNIILIWQYGWYGAAVATTISAMIGLLLSYLYTNSIMTVPVPFSEVGKQSVAAVVMAVIVYSLRLIFGEELLITIALIGIGAATYFVVLLILSKEVRMAVLDNLPINTTI